MMTEDNVIQPLATPTRFLIESGEWNLTPNIGGSMHQEVNPFDCNFQQQQPQQRAPITVIKSNMDTPTTINDKWTPPSPNVLNNTTNSNLYSTPTIASPESDMLHNLNNVTPPTPPMSLSQSPSDSSFSTISTTQDRLSSPIQQSLMVNSPPMQQHSHLVNSPPQLTYSNEDFTPNTSRRSSSRISTKQNFFSEYLENDEVDYKPKTASVQSGRKRRIVFEGDDAEDRRKKFLERNRVAAYKCRQKKKNWMQELEQKAEIQNGHNDELRALVAQLKEESMYLRNLLLTHGNCDCDSVQAYLRKTSAEITSNSSPLSAPSLTMSSRRDSLASNTTFPSMPSYHGSFSSIPSFTETSTGLTPFLNTVINKPSMANQDDYFTQSHTNETS